MHRIVVSCICALVACVAPVRAQPPPIALDTLHVSVGSRVSAALPVATRAVEVITAEEVARQPVRTVQEALGWALGVDLNARSPAQADVAVRGESFEQVLVLVDGARVSDAQTWRSRLTRSIASRSCAGRRRRCTARMRSAAWSTS